MSIWVGVVGFLIALAGSAAYIPQLQLLHCLQALIYVAVLVLARRANAWGFGAGAVVATAWNCLGLFVTHLAEAGVVELGILLRTGHVNRPDTLMVLLGTMAHFVLIAGCVAGFMRLPPGGKKWWQFAGGGFIGLAYMALIIVTTAPR
jgi:hypothetical protein